MKKSRVFSAIIAMVTLNLMFAQTLAARNKTDTMDKAQHHLSDQLLLITITNDLDAAVDRKDWKKARSFFADDLLADFSSLTGQAASTIKSDDLIAGWKSNLGPKKESFHLRGNHVVTIQGSVAQVYSHGYAWNKLEGNGEPLWEVWGHYQHEFKLIEGLWKITAFKFVKTHERGNMWVKQTPAP